MKAYDHVANLLKDAGGKDGIVSKKDAKALVANLRKEGRGTEALAAENLFKMIDAFNDGAGERVTGYDFQAARGFVETKMLENRDTNRNGFSQAEIDKMSPTGKALIELGRALEMEGPKGRIGHAVPEAGLNHTAALIRGAAGSDGIVSRADIDALEAQLYKDGRGTEAFAVSYFFRMTDHRDAGAGNRVTGADIDKAVDFAKEKMLKNKDVNNNGYSQAEVAKFSASAKAFLMLGQMIDAGIIKSAA